MRVGDEPTGQALFSGMKLTATCGNHRMPEEQQIVTNERFSQVMKAVEILFQDEGWQTESRSADLNHRPSYVGMLMHETRPMNWKNSWY
jgi:hypothetical protein